MPVTRRHVLAALAGTGALAVLGGGAVGWSWWDRPPGEGLKALSVDEHAFVQALAEAWMPPGGDPVISGAEAGLGHFMDDLLGPMVPGQAKELKLLLNLLDDFTVPRRLSRFQHLDLDTRIEVLRGWFESDNHLLRSGVQALIALLASGYTLHPSVAERVRRWYPCGYGR
ncbi:MAG: hypothetical protein EP330_27245 [Deltaproteobacteria bacterium]|nr:MAG: hypothetical protein EP330_27245 [Deltaproteobacteria bacterium]